MLPGSGVKVETQPPDAQGLFSLEPREAFPPDFVVSKAQGNLDKMLEQAVVA